MSEYGYMAVQIASAFVGSLGFAIFLNMKGRQIWLAGAGGAVTWLIYLICAEYMEGIFLPYFIAAIFVAFYAEGMARFNRAPATIFLTAAAIPLIPGGSLYYTMAGIVNGDKVLAESSGMAAITIALAIASAFVFVSIFVRYVRAFSQK